MKKIVKNCGMGIAAFCVAVLFISPVFAPWIADTRIAQAAAGWLLTGEYGAYFGGAAAGTGAKYTLGYRASDSTLAITDGTNDMVTFHDDGTSATLAVTGGQISAATASVLTFQSDMILALPGSIPSSSQDAAWFGWYGSEVLIAGSTDWSGSAPANVVTGADLRVGLTGASDIYCDDYIAGSTSCSIADTTATTINFGGDATTINMGSNAGNTYINNTLTVLDPYINMGAGTCYLVDSTASTTLNFARNAAIIAGSTATTFTVQGDFEVNGGDITSSSATANLLNSGNTTINFGGAATSIVSGSTAGTYTHNGDVNIKGGDVTFTTAATAGIADNTGTTTVNFARNAAVIAGGTGTTFTVQGELVVGGGDVYTTSGGLTFWPNSNLSAFNGNVLVSGKYRTTTIGDFADSTTSPDVSSYNIWRCYGTAQTITHLLGGSGPLEITILGSWLNEVQTITITLGDPGDTFTATFGAQTTAALAWDLSAADLKTALEGLSTIGAGNIAVTESPDAQYNLTFQGTKAETDVGDVTCAGTGCTATRGDVVTGGSANSGVIDDETDTGAGHVHLDGDWTTNGDAQLRLIYDSRRNGWRELSRVPRA